MNIIFFILIIMPRRYGKRKRTTRAPSSRIAASARRNRRYIKRRKGAGAQQRQLLTMNRNIMKLNHAVGLTKQYAQYAQTVNTVIGYNRLNGPHESYSADSNKRGFNIMELVNPGDAVVPPTTITPGNPGPLWPGFSPVFQATSEVENSNKFWLEKAYLKLHFELEQMHWLPGTPGSTTDTGSFQIYPRYPTDITIFVVSFKKDAWPQINMDYFDNNTLNPTKWNGDQTAKYWTLSPKRFAGQDALPMLNPAVFNIHAHRTFDIAQINSDVFGAGYDAVTKTISGTDQVLASKDPLPFNFVHNLDDTRKTVNITLPLGKMLKVTQGNSKWKTLLSRELEYHERRWLIVHVSGSSQNADNQAKVSMCANILYTGKGTN